jgi:hypothetical protein
LVLTPATRAIDLISIMPSFISGISFCKKYFTKLTSARETIIGHPSDE